MMPISAYCSLLLTTALFAFIPGPAMLFVAAQATASGRRAGLLAMLGIHAGCYLHVVLAAFGLAVLFHRYPLFYQVLRMAGAVYLVWLGIRMIGQTRAVTGALPAAPAGPPTGFRAAVLFRQSAVVEMLNPKTAIFFLSQLPLYARPEGGVPLWQQFLFMGVIVNLVFSLGDAMGLVLAGAARGLAARIPALDVSRAGGVVIAGLGLHLAILGR